MVEIEIFLSFDGNHVSFLSIPRSAIERLAVFPFRWIRYVMFTICGARGHLLTKPNGPSVDYDKTEIAEAENTYYYQPLEDCAFVDHQGLNDRLTSTARTARSNHFRGDVIQRDGHACVVTLAAEDLCDAAHLIPRSKGDEYIAKVIQLRSPGDNSARPSNVGIDDIINGVSLRKDLHVALNKGQVAFIKTPNYGLRPEDIKRFQRVGSSPNYITLHRLKEPENYDPITLVTLEGLETPLSATFMLVAAHSAGANVDALFQGQGEGDLLPSTVILDYVYGVAAYQSWHSKHGNVSTVMDAYHEKHYARIPPLPLSEPGERYLSTKRRGESDLSKAMDELNMVLMYVTRGITPKEAAERRQKEIEQEERAAQEASRSKVMEWRERMDVC